ncbi:hypothetical protein AB9F26_05395 [Falsihalocynthiibacter sp. BN13B15]|uniref:hypothetical protein n=1 Tax=Falsihalocynthiibacter sp. BN13B15 TaxID=3240871 RepID=UPI00350FF0E1
MWFDQAVNIGAGIGEFVFNGDLDGLSGTAERANTIANKTADVAKVVVPRMQRSADMTRANEDGRYVGSVAGFGFAVVEVGLGFITKTLQAIMSVTKTIGNSAIKKAANRALTSTQKQGVLREASQLGQGNLTLAGSATRAEAAENGQAWVGPGYRVASDIRTLVSADKMRTFCSPIPKDSPFTNTGLQVNFETRVLIKGKWIVRSNAHLDVSE